MLRGTFFVIRDGVPSKPLVMTFDVSTVDAFKESAAGAAFGPHDPSAATGRPATLEFGSIGEPWGKLG